ncbi:hypothetical protein [Alkalihalobacillus sp. BA299]|nr:hypothetical protein [Alkalihalobacillus sp. BA299]
MPPIQEIIKEDLLSAVVIIGGSIYGLFLLVMILIQAITLLFKRR